MTGSTRSSGGLDDRRKRLLFRCWHRGTREMDLILGRFADAEIADLPDDELAQLEHLIEVPDPDLYAALTGNDAAGAGICQRPVRPHQVVSSGGSRRMKPPTRSPAAIAGARPRADLCQCRRGRRRPGGLGSGARGRGAAEAAGGQPRRGVPRRRRACSNWPGRWNSSRPICRCCSFRPGTASPTTGCRRMAASWRSG